MAYSLTIFLLLIAISGFVSTEGLKNAKRSANCNARYPSRNGNVHTLCFPRNQYNLNRRGYKVSTDDIKVILDTHNKYRGQASNPSAANMEAMVWDDDLAKMAQAWAEQCIDEHDKNRYSYVYQTNTGQNLAFGYKDWETAITKWWEEINYFTYGYANGRGGQVITHYTQVMQATSSKVGCGYAVCNDEHRRQERKNYRFYFACDYISQNMKIAKPYKQGRTCEDCPQKCHKGLCDCGGLYCFNRGEKDINTCTCKCKSPYKGEQCLQLSCPYREASVCNERNIDECKHDYYDTKYKCPYKCGLCKESQRPTECRLDDKCYKSPYGCVFIGNRASADECKRLGINGKDKNFCAYTKCSDCSKWNNIPKDCPYKCGYCEPKKCPKCENGGTIDYGSCKCMCNYPFEGERCEKNLCPSKDPESCQWYWYCPGDKTKRVTCPYICRNCIKSRAGK